MSGILNNKQRILDTYVTFQGRSLMSLGRFNIKYVTFTDGGTFYKADLVSGSEDASHRIFFESCNLPQDQITFLADDSGKLTTFSNHSGYGITAGKIFSGSSTDLTFVTGSDFASTAPELLASSIDNFKKLLSIGTIDPIFEDAEFQVSDQKIKFIITDESPINNPTNQSVNVTHQESFFADKRLSNLPNFRFMPPINRVSDSTLDLSDPSIQQKLASPSSPQTYLSTYQPIGPINKLDFDSDIQPELDLAKKLGNLKTITFEPTTNKNSLAIQIFEMKSDTLLKLDVIDFGKFRSVDSSKVGRHVFFVGKVFLDDNDTHTFVRLFTLIFE